jgi:hypothetical protein
MQITSNMSAQEFDDMCNEVFTSLNSRNANINDMLDVAAKIVARLAFHEGMDSTKPIIELWNVALKANLILVYQETLAAN